MLNEFIKCSRLFLLLNGCSFLSFVCQSFVLLKKFKIKGLKLSFHEIQRLAAERRQEELKREPL